MEAFDFQREKLYAHKKHLYYLWLGSLGLFSILVLLFVIITVILLIIEPITSINTFEILESWLLNAFLFIFAIAVGITALVVWKEYRESQFKVLRLGCHFDDPNENPPEFFNVKEFANIINDAIKNVTQIEGNQGDRKHFWRLNLPDPRVVDPSWEYKWRLYTYLEAAGYLGAGFFVLALGYALGIVGVMAFSACIFTLGFFILVSAQARFDASWYINPIDLSTQPSLRKAVKEGCLLLPRWANTGTCNVYMRLKPCRDADKGNPLRVSLEAVGISVEGDKTRNQPPKDVWDEVWNCAFPSTGDYTINLKISSKEEKSETFIPLSTITNDTSVSGLFVQTLNPLLLAVVPIVITAIVTWITAG